jgi:hypothetical protein
MSELIKAESHCYCVILLVPAGLAALLVLSTDTKHTVCIMRSDLVVRLSSQHYAWNT